MRRPNVTRRSGIAALATLAASVGAGPAASSVRVVGGAPIQVESAPWAAFVASDTDAFELDCSGSVIDATHVVTAAHCLFDPEGTPVQASAITVTAGVSNVRAPDSTAQQRSVLAFRLHPGYASGTIGLDDVAVLQLATPLDLGGPAVHAVALPPAGASYPAQEAVMVAGFGLEDGSAAQASGALESLSATTERQGGCGDFSGNDIVQFDNGVVLCHSSPTSSVCEGDSGAGVVTTTGAPTLVGVVDASATGCPVGTDGIDTYVAAPEILDFIRGNEAPPTAPRSSPTTTAELTWGQPLVPGDTFACSTAGWPSAVQISYAFLDPSSGRVLQNGPKAHYAVPTDEVGKKVQCEVRATNAGGTTVVFSEASPAVAPPPRVRIAPIAPLTARRGQTVSVRVALESPRGLFGRFTVCAALPLAVGTHRCLSTTEPFGASGTFRFALSLGIKPGARLGVARIRIDAVAGSSTATATVPVRVRPKS